MELIDSIASSSSSSKSFRQRINSQRNNIKLLRIILLFNLIVSSFILIVNIIYFVAIDQLIFPPSKSSTIKILNTTHEDNSTNEPEGKYLNANQPTGNTNENDDENLIDQVISVNHLLMVETFKFKSTLTLIYIAIGLISLISTDTNVTSFFTLITFINFLHHLINHNNHQPQVNNFPSTPTISSIATIVYSMIISTISLVYWFELRSINPKPILSTSSSSSSSSSSPTTTTTTVTSSSSLINYNSFLWIIFFLFILPILCLFIISQSTLNSSINLIVPLSIFFLSLLFLFTSSLILLLLSLFLLTFFSIILISFSFLTLYFTPLYFTFSSFVYLQP